MLKQLWSEEHISFHGKYYNVDDIAFLPKPHRQPRIPVWVGGEGKYAQRRAGHYGDAWFPYFVKITPDDLAAGFKNVRAEALKAGRDPNDVQLACCLPVEITAGAGAPITDYLKGSMEQVTERLKEFIAVGCVHIGLQFMIPHYPERREQIERFAKEALPALKYNNSPASVRLERLTLERLELRLENAKIKFTNNSIKTSKEGISWPIYPKSH